MTIYVKIYQLKKNDHCPNSHLALSLTKCDFFFSSHLQSKQQTPNTKFLVLVSKLLTYNLNLPLLKYPYAGRNCLEKKKFKIMAQHRQISDTAKFKAVTFVSMSSTEEVIDATIFPSGFTHVLS